MKNLKFTTILFVMTLIFGGCYDNQNSSSNQTNENILLITDIHFDPFNSCGQTVTTSSTQCVTSLINQSNPELWNFPASTPNTYGQETNNAFLGTALANLAQLASTKNITKIFITGDLLSHQFPTQFASYVPNGVQAQQTSLALNTMNYVLYQISKAVPNAKMYYIFGNNDTDQADYSYPTASFMQQVTPLLAKYMANPTNFAATFSNGGYFNMPLNSGVDVIGLNFNPLTVENSGNIQDLTAAQNQLKWLSGQLEQAKNSGKRVIILQHEPFGMNAFNIASNYTPSSGLQTAIAQEYLTIYKQYSSIINNNYYGHYHMETIEIVNNILALSTLGLSVDFDNNPGFKILQLNTLGQLQNYTTFYTNFNNSQFNWQELYNLNGVYNITPNEYIDFFKTKLQPTNNPNWVSYVNNYSGNNNNNLTVSQMPIISPSNWSIFYCAINNLNSSDFTQCISNTAK